MTRETKRTPGTEASSKGRWFVSVAIAALTAYVVLAGGTGYGIEIPTIRLASVTVAGMVLAIWAIAFLQNERWRPRTAMWAPIAASLGSLAISTAFSRFPLISLEYLGYAILLAALYLLLVQLLRDAFLRRRFVPLAAGLFFAIAAPFFTLTVLHWVNWWQELGYVTTPPLRPYFESLTLGNPSAVLMGVTLLAVPLIGTADWSARRGRAAVVAVLLVVALVALLSGSRAGWLALAISGVVCVGLVLARASGRAEIRTFFRCNRQARRITGAVLLAGIALVLVALVLAPSILQRATAGGEANRTVFVLVASRLFAESPIVGTGPGSWVIQRVAETRPDEIDEYIPHAHNLYAQTLAEQGLVGAVAGLVLVVVVARFVLRATRSEDPLRRRWAWTTLAGLVYFAAQQLLDFYANYPAMLFLAALPVAWLDATQASIPRRQTVDIPSRSRHARGWATVAGVAVVMVAVVGLALQELPAMRANLAVDRANDGLWAEADPDARAAASMDPRISPYLFTAGLTAARAGDHAAAVSYFETVAKRDDLPEAWLNLAAEQLQLDGNAQVEAEIRAALRLGLQRSAISIAGGDLALRIGLEELAIDSFAHAVAATPSFLADPWLEGRDLGGLREAIAARATVLEPANAWEIALMMGDADGARDLAGRPQQAVHDFIDAWNGDADARMRLTSACLARPSDYQSLGFCARVASRNGDFEEAERFRSLLSVPGGASVALGTELRVAASPGAGFSVVSLASWWGPFTYRRFVPDDMLVPSLVHLTLA